MAYFHGDALGSVRQLTDASGTITLAKAYAPYGEVSSSSGTGTSSYGYTGEWTERNRAVQRFIGNFGKDGIHETDSLD